MLKETLNQLRKEEGICISILLPAERGFQDHKKTDAVLKMALKNVENQLFEKYGKRAALPFLEKLEAVMQDFDLANSMDGVGFFVNENLALKVDFPFDIKEKIIVSDSFETRDLVFAVNRLESYYVMLLSKEDARLYLGFGKELTEISDRHDAETESVYEEAEHGAWKYTKVRSEANVYHPFLNKLDKILGHYLDRRRLPVILLGDKESTNYFENHSDHRADIAAKIAFNYKNQRLSEIAELIAPEVELLGWKRAQNVRAELDEAVGHNLYAAGLQRVWQAAFEGRVHKLLVEKGFHTPAFLSADGYEIQFAPTQNFVKMEDAVDDLIEKVLDQNGEVFFCRPGELTDFQSIAAILRF